MLIDLPPPQYDHAFIGKMDIQTVEWADVADRCGIREGIRNRAVNACAWRLLIVGADGKIEWECHVILPTVGTGGIDANDEAGLLHHETGHCNGWPNDHPGAVLA